jgi:hypothetical protein
MSERCWVITAVPRKGLLVASFIFGTLHGAMGVFIGYVVCRTVDNALGLAFSRLGGVMFIVLGLGLFALPSVFAAMLVRRASAKGTLSFACGLLYAASCGFAASCTLVGLNPQLMASKGGFGSAVSMEIDPLLPMLFGVAITVCVLAVFLAGAGSSRLLGRRAVVQAGRLCWSCGYDLGPGPHSRCPECGYDIAAPARYWWLKVFECMRRLGAPGAVVALLLAAVLPVHALVTSLIPEKRFVDGCPGQAVRRLAVVWPADIMADIEHMPSQIVWMFPDPAPSVQGVAVFYRAHALTGKPRMYVSLAEELPEGMGMVGLGNVCVRASLSDASAERVLSTKALPAALVQALHERGQSVGWAPLAPATAMSVTPPARTIDIDGDPFFR